VEEVFLDKEPAGWGGEVAPAEEGHLEGLTLAVGDHAVADSQRYEPRYEVHH